MSVNLYRFTHTQERYAKEALLKLMLRRRFFLRQQSVRAYTTPDLFDSLRIVDTKLKQAYEQAQTVAEGYIQYVERELGFASPELSDGQAVVQCNRYGGGLEICTAWPLAKFATYLPKDYDELLGVVAKQIDTSSPSLTRLGDTAKTIWRQLKGLNVQLLDQRVVVVLKTRYHADGRFGSEKDLLDNKVTDLQQYAHALGYLLYHATSEFHLLGRTRDFWMLCSASPESHVALSHPAHGRPKIFFDASHTYPYKVHFVTVL